MNKITVGDWEIEMSEPEYFNYLGRTFMGAAWDHILHHFKSPNWDEVMLYYKHNYPVSLRLVFNWRTFNFEYELKYRTNIYGN